MIVKLYGNVSKLNEIGYEHGLKFF